MLYAQGLAHSSMRLADNRPPYSSRGRASRPAQDGLLPVHPFVLDVPATLRASTLTILMSPRIVREDTSVDRSPPAASPQSGTGCWSGTICSAPRGEQKVPSQHPRIQLPPDRCRVRPAAVARNLRLNSDSANDPCCSAQSWTLGHLRNGGVGTGPHGPGIPDPRLRAQMRQRHTARTQRPHGQKPKSRTRSRRHARAPRVEGPRGPPSKSRTLCEPEGFCPHDAHTPLVVNHAPSGWLFDRVSGLRARTWYQDAAPRTSPLVSIYGGGLDKTVCEQHRSKHNRTD